MSRHPATQGGSGGYDPLAFKHLFEVEDRHFWFRSRNRIIATVVEQITAGLPSGYRMLEVGCGTGNVLRVLGQACEHGTVVGMDLFAEGLEYARRRTSCSLVQGDVHMRSFRTEFDVIGLFDVLEHLADDVQVLRELHAMLTEEGALILTVRAHASLWSYFDESSRHCRRYELPDLKEKLIGAGYHVEYLTQYMAIIFPLIWLGRRLAATRSGFSPDKPEEVRDLARKELRIMPVINGLLTFLLAQERHSVARRWRLPIGASLLAVARKNPQAELRVA